MSRKTLCICLAVAILSFCLGYLKSKVDYVNMRTVTDFSATETGLTLFTSSGDSYYWER